MGMKKRPMYKPTPADIHWAHTMIKVADEMGSIVFPLTSLIYVADKEQKILTLINPEALEDMISFTEHMIAEDIFAVIGYKVYPGTRDEVDIDLT